MKRLRFPLIIALLTLIIACDKDDEETTPEPTVLENNVKLKVNAMFGNEDLELFTNYSNIDNYEVSVEQLKFYLSEIYLTKSDGSEELVSQIDLFDMEGDMSASYNVPAGSYSGFRYSLGVPQELNGTNDPDFDENIYPVGHPLYLDNGMYWGWTPGYKFMRWQGRTDTLPGSTEDIAVGYSFHTGLDIYYKNFEFEEPIEVSTTALRTLVVNMDVDRFMYNETDTLHFNTSDDTQLGPANSPLAAKFFNLIGGAITHDVE